jgi:uncharacterized membrane protein YedE/YeeE
MIDPGKAVEEASGPPKSAPSAGKLIGAAIFGLAFGFLLQKGGVAKFNVLIGALLLEDWTVAKVILTAIIVGMIGVFTLHHFAKVNLHPPATKLGAQIIGGLTFGIGFALIAYCPGTGAAALGQGSWDALFGILGLLVGSYLYAEFSGALKRSIERWGDKGKLLLPELLQIPRVAFIPGFAVLLTVLLFLIQRSFPR